MGVGAIPHCLSQDNLESLDIFKSYLVVGVSVPLYQQDSTDRRIDDVVVVVDSLMGIIPFVDRTTQDRRGLRRVHEHATKQSVVCPPTGRSVD